MATTNPQVYGQTPAGVTAPGSTNTLPGSTYEGSVASSLGSIPGLGGSLNSVLTALYGSKPATANPVYSSGDAVRGNLNLLQHPALPALTLGADTLTSEGAALPFQINLPGYESNLSQASGNTASELAGQIPQDVINQIQQGAAERGISTGQDPNSPNIGAEYLKSLGLTSLSQMATGQNDFSRLIGETPTGKAFDPSSMFVTPSQQQAAEQAANVTAAAPDPVASGLMSTIMGFI